MPKKTASDFAFLDMQREFGQFEEWMHWQNDCQFSEKTPHEARRSRHAARWAFSFFRVIDRLRRADQ
jgi:hypothetical protein